MRLAVSKRLFQSTWALLTPSPPLALSAKKQTYKIWLLRIETKGTRPCVYVCMCVCMCVYVCMCVCMCAGNACCVIIPPPSTLHFCPVERFVCCLRVGLHCCVRGLNRLLVIASVINRLVCRVTVDHTAPWWQWAGMYTVPDWIQVLHTHTYTHTYKHTCPGFSRKAPCTGPRPMPWIRLQLYRTGWNSTWAPIAKDVKAINGMKIKGKPKSEVLKAYQLERKKESRTCM